MVQGFVLLCFPIIEHSSIPLYHDWWICNEVQSSHAMFQTDPKWKFKLVFCFVFQQCLFSAANHIGTPSNRLPVQDNFIMKSGDWLFSLHIKIIIMCWHDSIRSWLTNRHLRNNKAGDKAKEQEKRMLGLVTFTMSSHFLRAGIWFCIFSVDRWLFSRRPPG